MQGWQFLHKAWPEKHIADYLPFNPPNRLLLLHLMADKAPYWRPFPSFTQPPFVWKPLPHFGGERLSGEGGVGAGGVLGALF